MVDLKSMNRKERVEYIWDYYKIHILGGAFLLFMVISIIYGQITRINYVANLTITSGVSDNEKMTEAEKQITELVVKDGDKKKQAMIDVIPIDNQGIPEPQLMQKFTVKMAAQEIDVVVLDKTMFDTLVKQDAFMRLDNMSEIDLAAIKVDKVEGTTDEGEKGVYAVSAEGNSILEGMGTNTKNKVIAIMGSTKRKDTAVSIFKWLIK